MTKKAWNTSTRELEEGKPEFQGCPWTVSSRPFWTPREPVHRHI